jgi:hypothetical protein
VKEATADRSGLWLPLLRRLTEVSPTWVVWKNVESALFGTGDIDCAAAQSEWPRIEEEFRLWAVERELGPVVVCRHIPGGLNLVAIPEAMQTFLEMGVKSTRIFRGSVLFTLDDLASLIEMDPRGFRRIRRGAEGFFKLLLNGTRWGGRPNWDGLRQKHVVELLQEDLEGARMAARLLGVAERAGVAGAERAASGGWDFPAMFTVDAWCLLRGLARPVVFLRRARFRLYTRTACPVVSAILGGKRMIPVDRDRWLSKVASRHLVYVDGLPKPGP